MRKLYFVLALAICTLQAQPAYAGPGGFIAKAVQDTLLGKIVFGVVFFVLFPLFAWMMITTHLASKRAYKDLAFMAVHSHLFDWLKIRERVKDCFFRVHSSWEDEDLSKVSDWMTDWYWQNQQLTSLERWKNDGLQNVCVIKKLNWIKPILFSHKNIGVEHEESMLVVSISANMQDYLQDRETGEVVEGNKKSKDIHTV